MSTADSSPDAYCQAKAARSGSSFYYSFRFLSQERRRAMTALYAFCREVDDVVDECSDPDLARTKLQWWRQELANLYQGQAQHPVTRALAPAVSRYGLPQAYFEEILDGMQMDLDYDAYPSFNELKLYCHRVAGVVGLLSAEIFGYEDRATLRYAERLGLALQLINILRDVREDLTLGRIYLPQDELARFQVRPQDLLLGQTSDNIRALFAFQAERARAEYRRALAILPAVDRARQSGGLIMGAIYTALLDEIEHDGFRILEHRTRLTPLRKLWIAWRTAVQARKPGPGES
jgi:phytoene synthase